MTDETVIRFRACPGSPYITQWAAFGQSVINVSPEEAQGRRIVGVYLNEATLRILGTEGGTVAVSPMIPFECGRVAVQFESPSKPPNEAPGPLQMLTRHYPPPNDGYGLQAQIHRRARPLP